MLDVLEIDVFLNGLWTTYPQLSLASARPTLTVSAISSMRAGPSTESHCCRPGSHWWYWRWDHSTSLEPVAHDTGYKIEWRKCDCWKFISICNLEKHTWKYQQSFDCWNAAKPHFPTCLQYRYHMYHRGWIFKWVITNVTCSMISPMKRRIPKYPKFEFDSAEIWESKLLALNWK